MMNNASVNFGEDFARVQDLIARVAYYSDSRPLNDYATLFTKDAIWEMEGGPAFKGLDAILKASTERRANKITGPESNTRHVVMSTIADIDGNIAKARSVFLFFTDIHDRPRLHTTGTYHDELRRGEGAWLLAHRLIEWKSL